jgi:transposase
MHPIEERGQVLNLYFHEGMGYKCITKTMGIPLDTVKSWCRRYHIANGISARGRASLSKEPIKKETIHVIKPRDKNSTDARIARLEIEVELLRNLLILTDEK